MGMTSIAMRHINRLFLAPAYLAMAFYFIGGAFGGVDMFKCGDCSKESRLMVHIAVSLILSSLNTKLIVFLPGYCIQHHFSGQLWSSFYGKYFNVAKPDCSSAGSSFDSCRGLYWSCANGNLLCMSLIL